MTCFSFFGYPLTWLARRQPAVRNGPGDDKKLQIFGRVRSLAFYKKQISVDVFVDTQFT